MPKPGAGAGAASGPGGAPAGVLGGRGQSPVLHGHGHPLKAHPPNSRELQAQMQNLSVSIFPPEGGQPPPPYPMGAVATMGVAAGGQAAASTTAGAATAAPPPPPPSYSQSLAMRQSPTLSSASSDYRSESVGGGRGRETMEIRAVARPSDSFAFWRRPRL